MKAMKTIRLFYFEIFVVLTARVSQIMSVLTRGPRAPLVFCGYQLEHLPGHRPTSLMCLIMRVTSSWYLEVGHDRLSLFHRARLINFN
jgi:hypothetical protein